MTKQIIFDVGANSGTSCVHYTEDPNFIVYAFEPTPHLLENYLYPQQKENYIVVPYAISDFNGEATFNVAGQEDWGCSSLHEFSDNLNLTWPGRQDFKVTESITVNVQRMDTFIENNNIEYINFLHCDTQGNDLKVLESFGKYIDILQSGVVEASNQNPLYKDVDNSVTSIINFLEGNNFMVGKITPNDGHYNEVNIEFKKV